MPEDYNKALGIISMIESGNRAPISYNGGIILDSLPEATHAPMSSSRAITTPSDLDLKTHDLFKSITKMQAYAKMDRMQHDSDRLARIEAKLLEPKGDVVTSFQKRTAREVEKLNQRLNKLMSKDGNAKNVNDEIMHLKNEIKELKTQHFEHNVKPRDIGGQLYGSGLSFANPSWDDAASGYPMQSSIPGSFGGTEGASPGFVHGLASCGGTEAPSSTGSNGSNKTTSNGGWGDHRKATRPHGWGTPSSVDIRTVSDAKSGTGWPGTPTSYMSQVGGRHGPLSAVGGGRRVRHGRPVGNLVDNHGWD